MQKCMQMEKVGRPVFHHPSVFGYRALTVRLATTPKAAPG